MKYVTYPEITCRCQMSERNNSTAAQPATECVGEEVLLSTNRGSWLHCIPEYDSVSNIEQGPEDDSFIILREHCQHESEDVTIREPGKHHESDDVTITERGQHHESEDVTITERGQHHESEDVTIRERGQQHEFEDVNNRERGQYHESEDGTIRERQQHHESEDVAFSRSEQGQHDVVEDIIYISNEIPRNSLADTPLSNSDQVLVNPTSTVDICNPPPLPEDKVFHAMICYETEDKQWARAIYRELESKKYSLKCCISDIHFSPSMPILQNIEVNINLYIFFI